ncbi:hypothetical protein E4U57_008225 [Claviceps arundinis]|uniref:Uncharacterized protein n=2 Tax=Claviceps arundinis TaxID=1623583 RepID=A0ABQ7PE38_9HYPO|nr:hypothetical protein E4U57_008225 [Claviceps arundinis]
MSLLAIPTGLSLPKQIHFAMEYTNGIPLTTVPDTARATLWNVGSYTVPHSTSLIVRSISALCALIGTISILPLVFFLIIDLILWLWRLISDRRALANKTSKSATSPDVSGSSQSSSHSTGAAMAGPRTSCKA